MFRYRKPSKALRLLKDYSSMRIGGIVKERKLRQNKDKWETMKSSRPRHGNVWDGGDNVDGEILEPR